jgi:tetratricopeptide (TPR) repeat protein/transcriptional regulator with XRE-family HTH domain
MDDAMESGMRRPAQDPPDPLTRAAATARTLQDLAALLRDLRRRHARERQAATLTYRQLAARTAASPTAVAEYLTGRTLPPTDRFDALLEALGAPPSQRRALADARDRIEEEHRRTRAGRSARHTARATGPEPGPEPGAGQDPSAVRAWTVPRQLPAAPRLFTGRDRELAGLDAALHEQAPAGHALTVCAISGMGGVGKTWLALHWAHRQLDRFPDGQLYVNLRGFDPAGEPLAASVVIRAFLDALGVPPHTVPVGQEAQVALYRSVLADRRVLVLLDNARDTAQILPLLPGGAACMVLITSRRQLTGLLASHGARSLAVDVLPRAEAHRLLARHLGRERLDLEADAATTLVSCCAGLPLALSIVAARAATQPRLPLGALATELKEATLRLDALDAGEPHADLRAVLSWSTRTLSPEAARAFALLGIAPGPDIAPLAAASLLGRPPAVTNTLLRELGHAHLIQRTTPERYRMHDLLTLHASEMAHAQHTAAEREAALRRLVAFYAHTACEAARLLAPHRPSLLNDPDLRGAAQPLPDSTASLAWFDATHAGLLTAQQLALRYGWDAQVWRLAWALDPYHRVRGHLENQAAVWRAAVSCAQRLDDPAVRAQAHQLLGDACAELGRTTEALHHLRLALAWVEQTGDLLGQGEIHHSLGGTWERSGDDGRALEHASRALLIFRQLNDSYRQARALNAVGWLQTRLGDHEQARANCLAALTLLRGLGEHELGESNTLDSLGYIAHRMSEYDEALDYFRQALDLCRAHGHSFVEADVLHHIAETQLAQGLPEPACDTWRQAQRLYTRQHRLADARRIQQRLDTAERQPIR